MCHMEKNLKGTELDAMDVQFLKYLKIKCKSCIIRLLIRGNFAKLRRNIVFPPSKGCSFCCEQ